MKKLRFGGPELPEGTRTWFEATEAYAEPCGHCQRTGKDRQGEMCKPCGGRGQVSRPGATIPAPFGLEVPFEAVLFADYYVNTGRASLIGDEKAGKPATAKEQEGKAK